MEDEPAIHYFDPHNGHCLPDGSSGKVGEDDGNDGSQRASQLTEELPFSLRYTDGQGESYETSAKTI